MTRFSILLFGLMLLLGGAAQAQDNLMPGEMTPEPVPQDEAPTGSTVGGGLEMEQPEDPCTQQVTETENALADRLQSGALGEETTDRVYELLDRADAECADGDGAAAETTLNEARAAAQ